MRKESPRGYGRISCQICGKPISTCGLGFTSHMRKHVRSGEAVEDICHGYYHYSKALAKGGKS